MIANYNQTALERMQELIEQLHKADIAYYRDDAPHVQTGNMIF